ncbi:MAG: phospholipase D family protein [Halieaceae bacterium]
MRAFAIQHCAPYSCVMIRSTKTLLISLVLLVAGCATVDFDAEKTASQMIEDTSDTRFGEAIAPAIAEHPGQSGFHLMIESIDALAARLLLAGLAERTLDVQYYLIGDDPIGDIFFSSLLKAADRGVRVRLLIDDLGTVGLEDDLMALSDHPNIQLRLFNPFASRALRAFDAWDFRRLNRRMHNKSFTADNQMTIIGGRNIATEYFALNPDYNFGDLDTLAIGPIVTETSRMFDSYWNHERAVPFHQLSQQAPDDGTRLNVIRASYADNLEALKSTGYGDAVQASIDDYLDSDLSLYQWADYELVFDSPDKNLIDESETADSIRTPLAESIRSTTESFTLISPYFVPRQAGIEAISRMQDNGIQVNVITNSLASSDHLLVYGGYAPVRKPLLEHGARIFEIRGDLDISGTEDAGTKGSKSSLHTKAFIVDRQYFFMGSFNWDPRSAFLNTELGVIIDSKEIAAPLADRLVRSAPESSYEVFLNEQGKLRWRTIEAGEELILDKEPDTGFWTRFFGGLSRLLPIESQL